MNNSIPPMEKRIPEYEFDDPGFTVKENHDVRNGVILFVLIFLFGVLFDHWFLLTY